MLTVEVIVLPLASVVVITIPPRPDAVIPPAEPEAPEPPEAPAPEAPEAPAAPAVPLVPDKPVVGAAVVAPDPDSATVVVPLAVVAVTVFAPLEPAPALRASDSRVRNGLY